MNRSKFLSDVELSALLATLAKRGVLGERNCLMIELLLFTGIRCGELLGLESSDLDHESRSIFIRALKGSVKRDIPLSRGLYERLASLCASSPKPFKMSSARFRQIWYEYRPFGCKKGLHSLRHTFALRLYRRTNDIKLVQMALGHKSFSNTAVYLDYVYSVDRMRHAFLDDGLSCQGLEDRATGS